MTDWAGLEKSVLSVQDDLVLLAKDDQRDGPLGRHEAPHTCQQPAVSVRVNTLMFCNRRVEVVDCSCQAAEKSEYAQVPQGGERGGRVPPLHPEVPVEEVLVKHNGGQDRGQQAPHTCMQIANTEGEDKEDDRSGQDAQNGCYHLYFHPFRVPFAFHVISNYLL